MIKYTIKELFSQGLRNKSKHKFVVRGNPNTKSQRHEGHKKEYKQMIITIIVKDDNGKQVQNTNMNVKTDEN